MEDILYDYFVSQGIAKQEKTDDGWYVRPMDYKRELYFEAVLKKYDLTRAEFDSSLVYYYTRSDRFVKIWKNVQERLGEAAIEYGASAGEVQTFTASTLTGDTANVWNGVMSQVLVPYSPYNRLQYQIAGRYGFPQRRQLYADLEQQFPLSERFQGWRRLYGCEV